MLWEHTKDEKSEPWGIKGILERGLGGRIIFEKAEKGGLSRRECSMKKRREKSRVFVEAQLKERHRVWSLS